MSKLDMREQDLLELYQLSQLFSSTYGDRLTASSKRGIKALTALIEERYKVVTGGEDITMATNPRNAGRPTVYTDEQNNRILDLRGEGLSLRRIAEEVNCSLAHVQRVLERQKG